MEFLGLVVAASVLVAVTYAHTDALVPGDPRWTQPWDEHKYIYMASTDPFQYHIAPFCWRIGMPLLAKALPFALRTNFLVITFAALVATAVAMYYVLRASSFSRELALVGMLVFLSMQWCVRAPLWDFWMPDALNFLIVVLLIRFALKGNATAFMVTMALGVVVKESVLFAAPLFYSLQARRLWEAKLARRSLLLALPSLAVYFGLHLAVPSMNTNSAYVRSLPESLWQVQNGTANYSIGWIFQHVTLPRLRSFDINSLFDYTVDAFGVLVIAAAFLSPRRNFTVLVRYLPFLILVYLQLALAVSSDRLLALGFAPMIVMALNGVDTVSRRLCVPPLFFVGLPLLCLDLCLSSAPDPFVALHDQELLAAVQAGMAVLYVLLLMSRRVLSQKTVVARSG